MTQPPADSSLFSVVAAAEVALVRRAQELWRQLRGGSLQDSFVSEVLPDLLAETAQTQATVADVAAGFTRRRIVAAGIEAPPRVVPSAFAGAAADGRRLDSLLAQPLIRTFVALDGGAQESEALTAGFDDLDRILSTTVQDTARASVSTVITATRQVQYYIRAVEPGACGRCIILAGRHYRWSSHFLRHPKCRCHQVPEDESQIPSPRQIWDGMTPEERTSAFGVAGAKAITDGADMGRVVNATSRASGMTGVVTTPAGRLKVTTARNPKMRGQSRRSIRLVPESIYQLAGDDRDEAIRLLAAHGYIAA